MTISSPSSTIDIILSLCDDKNILKCNVLMQKYEKEILLKFRELLFS